jgi:tetratricopeptide (TPR) repeat protein
MTTGALQAAAQHGLLAAAAEHFEAGRLEAAAAAYRSALSKSPDDVGILHNLGVTAARLGQLDAALGYLDAALRLEPDYASAHYNRAAALLDLHRESDALESLSRCLALDPGHYEAHRASALHWLAQGNTGRALDHFARTYELRRGVDCSAMARDSLTHTNRCKLLHDAAQFRHLADKGRQPHRFAALAERYRSVAATLPSQVTPLSSADLECLGPDYNTALYMAEAPEIAAGCLSRREDRDRIVRELKDNSAGYAQFDGVLTPAALVSLRRYLQDSTIWHDFSHIEGCLASYLEDGLASPLLLQLICELRALLPELLGPHPLIQAWAFKTVEPGALIDAHADDAAVSINLWLTGDSANLDPDRGGMVLCTDPARAADAPSDYVRDREAAVEFLTQRADQIVRVPYRENRAVIFRSRLLHGSDNPRFVPEYTSYRINLTLLFGHPTSA